MLRSMLAACLVLSLACASALADPMQLFIDPAKGSDSNDGSAGAPFATPYRAQAAIRAALPNLPDGGVVVTCADGVYDLSAAPLSFNASDLTTSDKPIIFQAAPGAQPIFSAGKQLNPAAAKTGDSGVVMFDLAAQNISDYGTIPCGSSLGSCPTASVGGSGRIGLTVGDSSLHLARYPNINASTGYWQFEQITQVNDPLSITVNTDRIHQWASEVDHLFLHGYWKFDWADNVVKVESLSAPGTNTMNISSNTPPVYNFEPKARWFAFNLLAELDAPGEFWVNHTSGLLYFIPITPWTGQERVLVAVGSNVLLISDTANIHFAGINFQASRQNAVDVRNSANVTIAHGTVRNAGGNGIALSEVVSSSALNMTVTHAGCKGITISSGNTAQLISGDSSIVNNTITLTSQYTRTYNPGIGFSGVGNYIAYNNITDLPHAAILGSCNDCLFEHNYIARAGFEVDDSGAFYTGRQWTARGNTVRFNRFESIRTRVPVYLGSPSVQGVYLDDQMSGYEVYNNSFYDCQLGVLVGGGRRNHVYMNTFEKCDTAIHLDDRGLTWQPEMCVPNGTLYEGLMAVHYREPPYVQAYPEIASILDLLPCHPTLNEMWGNTACSCGQLYDFDPTQYSQWMNLILNNTNTSDTGCVAPLA